MPSDRDDKVENILDVASRRPLVKDSQVWPIILLDAAKKDMRDLAARRLYATEFLTPWGPDALRMHLAAVGARCSTGHKGLTAAIRRVCTTEKRADALSVRFLRAALSISRLQRRAVLRSMCKTAMSCVDGSYLARHF
jgi:hypothetical protein